MSAQLMARVFASSLPPTKRLVMLALADFAKNETFECWPAIATVAGRTGLSDRSVRRTIRELEEDGAIETKRRMGRSGIYVLRLEKLPTADIVAAPRADRVSPLTPDIVSAPPRTERPPDTESGLTESPRSETETPDAVTGGADTLSPRTKNLTKTQDQNLPKTSSSVRGTRIPDDFTVTTEMERWARENCPKLLARPVVNGKGPGRQEVERFIDYWHDIPGAKGRKVDWIGTWRNWMRRTEDGLSGNGSAVNGHKPSTTDQRVAAGMELSRKYAEMDGS